MYKIYILKCSDNTLYTGITTDLEKRLKQHNGKILGGAKYTVSRRPVELVYSENSENRSTASKREYEIKKLTKKQKMELIKNYNNKIMKNKIKKVDCLHFYVDSLEDGIKFYGEKMGLKLIWKGEKDAGFKLGDSEAELVIQTKRKGQEVDLTVENVIESVEEFRQIGAKILVEPFDINIGKCAVIQDIWGNTFTILDNSKGFYQTDKNGNILGVKK